ncbi:MAG: hypothetical protein IK077_11195 [Thermoguttaceae bacterium]|nr:hypothetical protein [Thermoguttaceae bacterium]
MAAVCAFVTLALALLLFGVVLDCWILPDGLSVQGRFYYGVFGLAFTLFFFIWRLIPVFLKRVNVLFAAKELETAWEDKHNLTINWLQLCKLGTNPNNNADPTSIRQEVLRGVLLQAADNAHAHSETSVDYTKLIRWGVAFAVVVAVCSAYVVFSSKNPFVGARRIITPLAEIERPQALTFKTITPGDVVAYQGDVLEIEAEIPGTDNSSDVEILYSTSDGRLVDVAVPMESLGTSKFHAEFPDDSIGLVENVSYRVVVGRGTRIESSSESYIVEVRPLPSFRVEKVTLTFPEYTGIAKQTFENQGDVRAVEGTYVSLTARCNADLERASFLPDGERPRAQKMKIDANNPKLATVDFNLEWVEKNGGGGNTTNEQSFSFYQVVSHDVDGEENRDIQDYPVSIVADLPPTIRWDSAHEEIVEIPLNDVLHLKLVAEDPDFSLRSASLMFAFHNLNEENEELSNRPVPKPIELSFSSSTNLKRDYSSGPTPFVGVNSISCEISPEKLGLSIGDEVEYWAVAYDSKLPNPNSGVTERRIFSVVAPVTNPHGINVDSPEPDEKGKQEGASSPNESSNGDGENQDDNPSKGSEQTDGDQEGSPTDSGKPNSSQNDNQSEQQNGLPNETSGEGEEKNESDEHSSNSDEQKNESDETNGGTNDSNQNYAPNQEEQKGSADSNGSNAPNSGNQNNQKQDDPKGASPSESRADQQGAASPDPSDNLQSETSPGVSPNEAFEKILDYINETDPSAGEGAQNNNDVREDPFDSEQSNRNSNTPSNGNRTPAEDQNTGAKQSDEKEVDPDFNSDVEIPPSDDRRELPTRTSSQKPDPNAPSYQAENPDSIDPNTSRKEGDVDPNTNNFLGHNPSEDSPNTDNVDENANIMLDPDDQAQPVAADEIDPNAAEAKGNPNSDVMEAPYEVDQQQNNKNNLGKNSQNDIGKRQLPGGINGNGNSPNDDYDNHTLNDASNEPGSEKDHGQSVSQNDDKQTPSNGNSNDDSARQGGGGGTGMGEVESERQTLAPADSPKLQYAEKATNLVLGYLEDSLKDKVDHKLLDELGWTEEQLNAFLKRWQKMRDEAENGNEQELKNYLKALEETTLDLKKLGSDEDDSSPGENKRIDKQFQNRSTNEATRIKTPDRLTERVRAFTQGVSQGVEKR